MAARHQRPRSFVVRDQASLLIRPAAAADLQKIYKSLNTKLFFEQRETEVTAFFAAAAAALALVSGMLSMLWFNRIL